MKRNFLTKACAGVLSVAMVATCGVSLPLGKAVGSAADSAPKELTKILEAEDIDLRYTYNDESNLGEPRSVELSDRTTIQVKDNGAMRDDMTSQKLVEEEMGMGINLGNTLEAVQLVGNKKSITDRTAYDTAWTQPVTTRAYIDLLHSYGINTLRIPVAWSNGDIDDGTYTIKPALLDRVEEVANYALDNGMYVIINDHWDNQWWGQFGACVWEKDENGERQGKLVDQETRDNAWKRFERYWEQISDRFQNYSDHLIFEAANEELGDRLNDPICVEGPAKGYIQPDGSKYETCSGNLKTDELYDTVNKINQKFVDVVRATGGNNAKRHLLIPGFNTNIQNTADERFKMPEDKENGTKKLFLSVHYYTPDDFCNGDGGGLYTEEDQAATKTYFKDLSRFDEAGYGIIVGECGVCSPSASSSSVTQCFYDEFTEAKKYHAVPVLWDTGTYFDKSAPKIVYKDIGVFLNTVNQASGSLEGVERVTGGAPSTGNQDLFAVPDYLDKTLWNTVGIHAYLFYQTSNWDYRNAYKPIRNLGNEKDGWIYATASGSELSTVGTKVTDVLITQDGEYTVGLEGAALSGANFKMLGVSTDIEKSVYPNVKVTDATCEIDGKQVNDSPFDLIVKGDDKYYDFMLINVYAGDDQLNYPLGKENDNQTLAMPSKSIKITFKISGLSQVLTDIESGEYVNPETGESLNGSEENPPATSNPGTQTPNPGTQTPAGDSMKKGASFTDKNFKYKLSAAVKSGSKKGTVSLTGLTKKGKSAKSLKVPATVKKNGITFTVKSLGSKAFSGAKASAVALNKNIKTIPSSAFANCKKLKTLTLKAKLKKVSKNAFKGCKKKIKVKGTSSKANKKLLKKKTSYKKFS